MIRLGLVFLLLFGSLGSFGQGTKNNSRFKVDLNLDVLSSHLWRGYKNGDSYSIQPTIVLDFRNFKTGSWAAFSVDGSYFELDLFTEYSIKNFTIALYDYYCPPAIQMKSFTEFRKYRTKHTLDLIGTWISEKIPIKLLISTMILGDDIHRHNRKQAYSTYIEPSFDWECKRFSGEIAAGFTPFRGYYAENHSFINLCNSITYKMQIGKYVLPIKSKITYNPALRSTWYMMGISLSTN